MKKYNVVNKDMKTAVQNAAGGAAVSSSGVSDAVWQDVAVMSVSEQPWFSVPDVSMDMQIMWDKDRLYIHQKAHEKHIRAENTQHLSNVFEDSCMEFFIAPDIKDSRYFNFEINPNGALLLGFGKSRYSRIRLLPENIDDLFNIRTVIGNDTWEVFYEIPFSFFESFFPGFCFERGMSMMANCYKCGDRTDHVHYLSWNRMTSDHPEYHRYCDFGRITLV